MSSEINEFGKDERWRKRTIPIMKGEEFRNVQLGRDVLQSQEQGFRKIKRYE
jgi:hypothetical protein